ARMRLADQAFLDPQAPGDDHLAVLGDRFADRIEAFLLGAVEKAAGVDEHDVGALVVARKRIALRAERGQDAFGIDKGLGAAEADQADFGLGARVRLGHGAGLIRQTGQRAMRAGGRGGLPLPRARPQVFGGVRFAVRRGTVPRIGGSISRLPSGLPVNASSSPVEVPLLSVSARSRMASPMSSARVLRPRLRLTAATESSWLRKNTRIASQMIRSATNHSAP